MTYTVSALLVFGVTIYQILDPLSAALSHIRTRQIILFFLQDIGLLIIGFALYLGVGAYWLSVAFLAVGILVFLISSSIFFFKWWRTSNPWSALDDKWNYTLNERPMDLTDRLMGRFGRVPVLAVIALLIVVPQGAKVLGFASAASQRSFLVSQGEFHLISVRGTTGVFIKVVNGKSSGEVLLTKIDGDPNLTLQRQHYASGILGVDELRRKPTLREFWSESVLPLFFDEANPNH